MIDLELLRLRSKNVFVLRHGEIEAYLPPCVSGVKGVVALTTDRNWINGIADESRRVELGHLICQILDASVEERELLEQELRQRKVAFPLPVSERMRKKPRGNRDILRFSMEYHCSRFVACGVPPLVPRHCQRGDVRPGRR
jgi:hypothetical protein